MQCSLTKDFYSSFHWEIVNLPSMWTTKDFIYFHMADPANILFYEQVFKIYHSSYEKWVFSKYEWSYWFQNSEWAVPIVKTEANYCAPILAGKEIEIRFVQINKGKSSFEIHCEIHQENQLRTKILTKHVFISKSAKSSIEIPVDLPS